MKSQENFRQSSVMLDYFYNELIRKSGLLSKNGSRISVELLKELPEPSWFLFRYLTPYGFTSSQIIDIYESLDSDPGRQFFSESHILVRDREYLLLSENMELDRPELLIEESRGKLTKPVTLEWKTIDADKIEIEKSSGTASLDFDKLKFPLSLRPWRSGDSFFPFGMNRRKKLSDFFIDQKLSLLDKRNIWLLTSEDQIVWIIGHRIDNRFRISPQTKMVFRIQATT